MFGFHCLSRTNTVELHHFVTSGKIAADMPVFGEFTPQFECFHLIPRVDVSLSKNHIYIICQAKSKRFFSNIGAHFVRVRISRCFQNHSCLERLMHTFKHLWSDVLDEKFKQIKGTRSNTLSDTCKSVFKCTMFQSCGPSSGKQ